MRDLPEIRLSAEAEVQTQLLRLSRTARLSLHQSMVRLLLFPFLNASRLRLM